MKKLFLFTLICSLGFFTACSDDDDNDTPTPTPPEVNLQDFRLIVHRLPAFEIQVDGQIGILEFQLELDGSSSDTSVSIGGHFS